MGYIQFTHKKTPQTIRYMNLLKSTTLHANSYWTNRFLLSDTNNCRRGNSEWNSLWIISQDYTNICHPLSFITAQRYSYMYIAQVRRDGGATFACIKIDRQKIALLSLLSLSRADNSLLHASGNPFISIFNCRCAVYSVT